MKRSSKILVFTLLALLFAGLGYFLYSRVAEAPSGVGGERDEKGCLLEAGYAYSEEVGACIRAFEMTVDIMRAAKLAVDYAGKGYALSVASFNSYEEVGAYEILLERGIERVKQTVYIRGWKVRQDSLISGQVLLGPTCPVQRIPPDPNCADKGYETTVQVIEAGTSKNSPFTMVKTDKAGRFNIMLPPGQYTLQPTGGKTLPRCETKNITVLPNTNLQVNLSCDSGIR